MRLLAPALFGAILTLGLMVTPAQSQVVIYKLEFKKLGKSINYSFYDEGFVVAPAAGGSPTYLFTFRDNTGMNHYTKFVDFGEYFMAVNRKERKAVLATDSDTEVNLFALMALGEPNIRLRVNSSGFIATVDTAMTLDGFVMSADDESELPFDSSVENLGYAGSSAVKGTLQRDRTDRANRALQSVEETVADLEAELQRKGFTEFDLGGDPTEPTNPTDPTDPTDPTNPTDPTDGTDGTGTGNDGTNNGTGTTTPTLPDGGTTNGNEVVVPAVPIDGTTP